MTEESQDGYTAWESYHPLPFDVAWVTKPSAPVRTLAILKARLARALKDADDFAAQGDPDARAHAMLHAQELRTTVALIGGAAGG